MVSLLLIAGCSLSAVHGVLTDQVVTTEDGQALKLILDAEHEALRHLDGCTVRLDGPHTRGRIWVREWRVITALDGSTPYLGRLRAHGSNLVLEDRDSGFDVILEERSADALWPYAGEEVMVVGLVVAPQVVRVMGWRLLSDAGPAGTL